MCVLFQAEKLQNIFFPFQLRTVSGPILKGFCKTSIKCSAHPSLAKSISYFCPSLKTPGLNYHKTHKSSIKSVFFVSKCTTWRLPLESLPQNVKAYLGKKISTCHESVNYQCLPLKDRSIIQKKSNCMFFHYYKTKNCKAFVVYNDFLPKNERSVL